MPKSPIDVNRSPPIVVSRPAATTPAAAPPSKTATPPDAFKPAPAKALALNPTIPADVQKKTLEAVYDRVNKLALTGGKPVVEIDLDLTALMPIERTKAGLKQIGAQYSVPELQNPDTLSELPGYTIEAWSNFLDATGLGAKYPALRGIGSLDGGYYWNDALIDTDVTTPGLREFAAKVKSLGGTVVFNSGRWQPDAQAKATTSLARGGLKDYVLLIGNPGYSDAMNKEVREKEIREKYGTVVAIFDDRASNRAAMVTAAGGDPLSIAIAIPGFSHAPDAETSPWRVSTFEG